MDSFFWRSAHNSNGALIANVRAIKEGDRILVAWRYPAGRRMAYLCCQVAGPLSPVVPGLIIDGLKGLDARAFVDAGYPTNASGAVEGIRLDEIAECYFEVAGSYGGNNGIHRLAADDMARLATASTIPIEELMAPKATHPQCARSLLIATPGALAASVDHFKIQATSGDRAFDAYVMVDWSSSSQPVTGNDSIWIAWGAWSGRTFSEDTPINVSTRRDAVDALIGRIAQWRDEGKRVLVGFDFAFGYPAGFATALGLRTSGGTWRALHTYIATHVTDSLENAHNRDAFAEKCNRTVGAPGPFWGCAKGAANAALTQHRVGVFSYPHHGLQEWRATDLEAKKKTTTQSVWKLNCGVSVGGQTILGIKHLDQLANAVAAHRWPFDGWGIPSDPAIWFAEIFPSLVYYPEWAAEYATWRDRTQVRSCVRWAVERDRDGLLKSDFDRPTCRLDAETLSRVEDEEGWMLWV